MYFSLVGNYLRPSNNSRLLKFNINAVVYLNLSIFTVFLENKNIIFKIRRSKVTDYAALNIFINISTYSNIKQG